MRKVPRCSVTMTLSDEMVVEESRDFTVISKESAEAFKSEQIKYACGDGSSAEKAVPAQARPGRYLLSGEVIFGSSRMRTIRQPVRYDT